MGNKKTLVIGASENTERYSNKAIRSLRAHKIPVEAIGKTHGQVEDIAFAPTLKPLEGIDTITLYINPTHQQAYYQYILDRHPRRIIFNPGTENQELEQLAIENGIVPVEACTLVLLATGQF